MVNFSIIIPTYNRANSLMKTVESLLKIDYLKNLYEIIIVDNNSSDLTKEKVKKLVNSNKVAIRYFFERRLGLMFARHKGVKEARGNILYFVDDDIIVSKSVLKKIEEVFNINPKIACVTGKIIPRWEKNPPDWILKYFQNHILSVNNRRKEKLLIAPYDVGVFGCHEAVKRAVIFEAGGFNPDSIGENWIGDGETGLNLKIEKLGYFFAYTDKTVVYHRIPAQRLTQKYINHRFANQGRSQSYTDLKKHFGDNLRIVGYPLYYIIQLMNNVLQFLIYLPLSDKWHVKRAYLSYYASRILYDLRFIVDIKFRKIVLRKNWL